MRGLIYLGALFTSLLAPISFSQAIEPLQQIPLPADYLSFLQSKNGDEGWLGEDYFILWRADDLVSLNHKYEVEHYAPGIFLFGSTGSGDAWGFDLRANPPTVVRIPFVGMAAGHVETVANSFSELLQLSASHPTPSLKPASEHAGMELFEIQPIIFGGDPVDPANKEWKSREEHIQLVRFWNQTLEKAKQD
ncbi:SMI1/KNR4 family protein [Pseudomonas sp. B28(2017)]|uniref:SMI1/KNR4 family protein n=1 Tax=Pseudomonas sp. B28(2017) TaxID=1981730 RepID=UPI001C45A8A5|nr:SMI1/KNR4 family protein [Pseudomonas sp. B28(2017)]